MSDDATRSLSLPSDATADSAPTNDDRRDASTGSTPAAPPGYELLEEIGAGGMGVVFRAREITFDRDVAVKLLHPHYSAESAAARRFLDEARITGQLQHPGIPPVHHIGNMPDGRPFLVMKLVKGDTLANLITNEPNERSRFVAAFAQVCQAVGYAHARKVIHRDLKPANIMVGAFGEVQVMDWGLAKVMTGEPTEAKDEVELVIDHTEIRAHRDAESATQAGSILGTPAFMSPEQAGGEIAKIDERSDVFGLGAVLCAILTGKPPYIGTDVDSIRLKAIRGDRADAFARLESSGADAELLALCKRCLATDRDARPRHAGEVAEAITNHLAAAQERARQAELERAAVEVRIAEQKRRRKVWYGLAVALLLGATVSLISAIRARQAEAHAIEQRDLTEKAKIEAQENLQRALTAEQERKLEAGRTALASARRAASRGRWEEALGLYETASELGGNDEIELQLGRYDCLTALGRLRPAIDLLDELAKRNNLNSHEGPILLRRAENALWRSGDVDPKKLAEQAIEKGLPPSEQAYSKIFLTQSVPEAIDALQETLALDAFHSRGLDMLASMLLITGRKEEAREAMIKYKLLRPQSANQMSNEVWLQALYGDRDGAEKTISRLKRTGYAELAPMFQKFADLMIAAQDPDFFLGGVNPQMQASLLTEFGSMAGKLAKIAGDPEGQAAVGNMRFFQLPMFRAVAEMPHMKANSPIETIAILNNPAKLTEIIGGLAKTIPDGTHIMLHALMLRRSGRLEDSEARLRQAIDTPSWANHRRAAQFNLMAVQWELANRPASSPKDRAAWKAKAIDNLRDLATSGTFPPDVACTFASIAAASGETVHGLSVVEAAARKKPDHVVLLSWKLNLESKLNAMSRAEATANKLCGLSLEKPEDRRTVWNALISFAKAYLDSNRTADALRWCDAAHERLQRETTEQYPNIGEWNSLGVLYWRMKKFDKSIPIFERVLESEKRAKGERHADTLFSQINLGVNFRDSGKLDAAILMLESACRNAAGNESLRWGREALLTAYVLAKKSNEGTALANELLQEDRKKHAPQSDSLASALVRFGGDLLSLSAWKDAEAVLREGLAIREKIAPDMWNTFNAKSMLGDALARQKKFAEAETLLLDGYAGIKKREATIATEFRGLRLGDAIDRLIRFYEAIEKKDEVARWQKERAGISKP